MPIYKVSTEGTRWEAVFSAYEAPVLTLRADCSLFVLKPASSSPHLPAGPQLVNRLKVRRNRPQGSNGGLKVRTEQIIGFSMGLPAGIFFKKEWKFSDDVLRSRTDNVMRLVATAPERSYTQAREGYRFYDGKIRR